MSLIFSIGQELCSTLLFHYNSYLDFKLDESSIICFVNDLSSTPMSEIRKANLYWLIIISIMPRDKQEA